MNDRTLHRRATVIRELIAAGRRPRVAMSGTSMRPMLRTSMTLELGPAAAASVGDVLLFEGPQSLVAHRVVAREADGWVTAGDAVRHVEHVRRAAAVGRVERVVNACGRRIDGTTWRIVGRGIAAQRAARYRLRRAVRETLAPAPLWPAFVRLLRAATTNDRDTFARTLRAFDEVALFALARRHRCAGLIAGAAHRWRLLPRNSVFARSRLQTALHADAYLRDVVAVVRALTAAGCRFALLKGAARAYEREPGHDLHRSFDIDVLVCPQDAASATAALRQLGYAPSGGRPKPEHHHLPPLVAAGRPPVELHVALAPAWRFSMALDAATMLRRTRRADGPAGPVEVLDDLARIVHLCVHAASLQPMRDLALAAGYWRALAADDCRAIAAEIDAEQRDRVRLRAALAYLRAIAGEVPLGGAEVERYLAWVAWRERLPDAVRDRCDALDAWYAKAPARTAFDGIGIIRRAGRLAIAVLTAPFVRLADEPALGERRDNLADVGFDVA